MILSRYKTDGVSLVRRLAQSMLNTKHTHTHEHKSDGTDVVILVSRLTRAKCDLKKHSKTRREEAFPSLCRRANWTWIEVTLNRP